MTLCKRSFPFISGLTSIGYAGSRAASARLSVDFGNHVQDSVAAAAVDDRTCLCGLRGAPRRIEDKPSESAGEKLGPHLGKGAERLEKGARGDQGTLVGGDRPDQRRQAHK